MTRSKIIGPKLSPRQRWGFFEKFPKGRDLAIAPFYVAVLLFFQMVWEYYAAVKGLDDGTGEEHITHTTPHHTTSHHTTLHHTHTTPHHITPHYTTSHTLHHTLYYTTLHTSLHHITPHWATLHHTTPHYITPHHTTPHKHTLHTTLHHTSTHYTPHKHTLHTTQAHATHHTMCTTHTLYILHILNASTHCNALHCITHCTYCTLLLRRRSELGDGGRRGGTVSVARALGGETAREAEETGRA